MISHQTARLGRRPGRNRVTVMQLAALLAGERPTDRPRSACPIIAAFLRAYSETIDDERRRDLYRCAAAAVGTNVKFLEGRRARCVATALAEAPQPWLPWRRVHPDRLLAAGRHERVAALAGRALAHQGIPGHMRALALLDEMVGMQRYPGAFEPIEPIPA